MASARWDTDTEDSALASAMDTVSLQDSVPEQPDGTDDSWPEQPDDSWPEQPDDDPPTPSASTSSQAQESDTFRPRRRGVSWGSDLPDWEMDDADDFREYPPTRKGKGRGKGKGGLKKL